MVMILATNVMGGNNYPDCVVFLELDAVSLGIVAFCICRSLVY